MGHLSPEVKIQVLNRVVLARHCKCVRKKSFYCSLVNCTKSFRSGGSTPVAPHYLLTCLGFRSQLSLGFQESLFQKFRGKYKNSTLFSAPL